MAHLAAIGVLVVLGVPLSPGLQEGGQPGLRVVEEGFEDVSPLASPSRVEPTDFRQPLGFERVYEFTTPTGETVFVRIDNGLAAFFDRSDYLVGTGDAFVPPNTRFQIGTHGLVSPPPPLRLPPSPARSTSGRPVVGAVRAAGAGGGASARPSTRVQNRVPNLPRQKQHAQAEPVPDQAEPGPSGPDQSDVLEPGRLESPPGSTPPSPSSPSSPVVSGPPAIVTNEFYRRLRITQLLQEATGLG